MEGMDILIVAPSTGLVRQWCSESEARQRQRRLLRPRSYSSTGHSYVQTPRETIAIPRFRIFALAHRCLHMHTQPCPSASILPSASLTSSSGADTWGEGGGGTRRSASICNTVRASSQSQEREQLVPSEVVALIREFGKVGVERDHGVLRAQVGRVVDANVHLSNLARRMEEALQGVVEEHARTERNLQTFDGRHDRSQYVRAGLKDVGPNQIEQMLHALLVSQAKRAESQMMDDARRRLSMHVVSVGERVVQAADDRVDVIFAHLANVLKHPAQRLETAVAHVELRRPILVEDGRDGGERTARLGHDGDRHRRANTRLSLLHAQIGQKHLQHVRRSDGTRNVAKAVHRSPADGLLVRLEQIQQLKADAHPLARTDKLGALVGDPADEVDARFLHLLVTVAQDGRHARKQIFDGRAHLRHTHHIGDGRLGADDRCQSPRGTPLPAARTEPRRAWPAERPLRTA
ncbi:hypothetical protein L1887_60363 [Cichorium endivia]|nr:hypothetical protein L1887_60363 [Cichorium endivia]